MDKILFRKIANENLYLSKCQKLYNSEKKHLMNQSKMIEYLFNKPTEKINCLNDLIINYDSTIKTVRLEKNDAINIMAIFFVMMETLSRYCIVYQLYKRNLVKYNKYTKPTDQNIKQTISLHKMSDLPRDKNKALPKKVEKIEGHYNEIGKKINPSLSRILGKVNYLPIISELSIKERQILKILNKYETKYKMSYLYKWNFLVDGEHLILSKLPSINIEHSFDYGIYGIMIHHGQLVQFVIEYDDETHFGITNKIVFPEVHLTDITKQYMLFQMNINLLRLNKKSNLENEIAKFLRKIKNTTNYIIQNPIKPIAKYFSTEKINDNNKNQSKKLKILDYLNQFLVDYEYNHIVYLKLSTKNEPMYESDDDEYFDNKIDKNIYSEQPGDTGLVVTDEIFHTILEDKKDLHSVKYQRADDIIVELIGAKK